MPGALLYNWARSHTTWSPDDLRAPRRVIVITLLIGGISNSVTRAARGVLQFAFQLVGLTFGLQLCVAGNLPDGILHGALSLICGALYTIRVHICIL